MRADRPFGRTGLWMLVCTLSLLGAACGGDGDQPTAVGQTSSTASLATTTPPEPSTSTSASSGASATRPTISTTVPPPTAETPIDNTLIPEKDQLSVSFGKATINGKDYTSALIADPFNNRTSRLEIDAGRRRTRLLGDLGIPDDQRSSTAYKVDISFDQGPPALSTEVRFGETKEVDLDVTGVLRIKVAFTPLTPSGTACCGTIAIGEPRLR